MMDCNRQTFPKTRLDLNVQTEPPDHSCRLPCVFTVLGHLQVNVPNLRQVNAVLKVPRAVGEVLRLQVLPPYRVRSFYCNYRGYKFPRMDLAAFPCGCIEPDEFLPV